MPHHSVISPTEHRFLANLPISCFPRSPPDFLSVYTLFGSSLPTILCRLSSPWFMSPQTVAFIEMIMVGSAAT